MGKWHPINLPIAQFVAAHIEFTYKDSDEIPLAVVHQVYMAYAKNPVEEPEFGRYIADHYSDLTVTKRKVDGMYHDLIKRCKFRVVEDKK